MAYIFRDVVEIPVSDCDVFLATETDMSDTPPFFQDIDHVYVCTENMTFISLDQSVLGRSPICVQSVSFILSSPSTLISRHGAGRCVTNIVSSSPPDVCYNVSFSLPTSCDLPSHCSICHRSRLCSHSLRVRHTFARLRYSLPTPPPLFPTTLRLTQTLKRALLKQSTVGNIATSDVVHR